MSTSPAHAVTTWWRRWPWLVDVAPLLLELPVIADLSSPDHHDGGSAAGPWAWVFAQALIVPLLLRRRFPRAVFAALLVVGTVQCLVSKPDVADFAFLVALYTVAAQCERRDAYIAAGVLEVGVIAAAVRFHPVDDDLAASIVFLTGLLAAALLLGLSLRTRRDYLASLEDRARRLERERDQQAELAATAERTRIAREMHDIVAHSLSVVITLADGAALAVDADPVGASTAMTQVGDTGRQALAEMRRLLGVLRDERPAELAPQPDLARLDALFEDVRAAGLPVTFTVSGQPRPLPTTGQTTVYRIVQESLTNALKHAVDATLVRVALRWQPDGLSIEITDDGAPIPVPAPVSAGGVAAPHGAWHGLRGIRERVAIYDGELTSGPARPRGWRVCAVLRITAEPS